MRSFDIFSINDCKECFANNFLFSLIVAYSNKYVREQES